MKPWNPYAMTFNGEPITGQVPPKVVVYGPPMTAQQGSFLQYVFALFQSQARLSVVQNPTTRGRFADGTPYTIECSGGSCTCTVWTKESGDDAGKKRGFVAILDFLTGLAAGEFKATVEKIPGARLLWRKKSAWSVEDKKFSMGDTYLPYKVAQDSAALRKSAVDAEKIKTDIKGHADVVTSKGGALHINTVPTSYKIPAGVPLLVGYADSKKYSAYGVRTDRVLAVPKEGGDILVASTLDEKAKLTAEASVFSETFDCTKDMKIVSFFGVGNDRFSWHHWGVRATLDGGGALSASTQSVQSRTWPGEVAIDAEGAPFISKTVNEWVGDTDDKMPNGHLGYRYHYSYYGPTTPPDPAGYWVVLQYSGETEINVTPVRKGTTTVDTYSVARAAQKTIRAGFLNGETLNIEMSTSLKFSYKGETGSGTWVNYWPEPTIQYPEIHASYFYGGGYAPGQGAEYTDGSGGYSRRRRYTSSSKATCSIPGTKIKPISEMTITQEFDSIYGYGNIYNVDAGHAGGKTFNSATIEIGHIAWSFAGGFQATRISEEYYTKDKTKEVWEVNATTRDYIYHSESDGVSVFVRSEFKFNVDLSSVEVFVDVVGHGSGGYSSKKIYSKSVSIQGMLPLTLLLVQINNPWYHAAVVPPTPVFAPVACEQGDFPYIAHTTQEERERSAPGFLLSLPLHLYFRIPDYIPPTPPRALSYYPIQMAKVWEAFGLISLHSLPFDLDKVVNYIEHDDDGFTRWTQSLVSDAGKDPEKSSATIYRT